MIVNGKLKVELDLEVVDEIVKDVLYSDYLDCCEQIKRLNKKNESDPLTRIDKEDLEAAAKRRVAFEELLQYYMPLQEFDELYKGIWGLYE